MCNTDSVVVASPRPVEKPMAGVNWIRCTEIYRNLLDCLRHNDRPECVQFVQKVKSFAMEPYKSEDCVGDEELRLLHMVRSVGALGSSYDHFERVAYMIEHYVAAEILENPQLDSVTAGVDAARCNRIYREVIGCMEHGHVELKHFLIKLRSFAMEPRNSEGKRGDEEMSVLIMLSRTNALRQPTDYRDYERVAYMIEHYVAAQQAQYGNRPGSQDFSAEQAISWLADRSEPHPVNVDIVPDGSLIVYTPERVHSFSRPLRADAVSSVLSMVSPELCDW